MSGRCNAWREPYECHANDLCVEKGKHQGTMLRGCRKKGNVKIVPVCQSLRTKKVVSVGPPNRTTKHQSRTFETFGFELIQNYH